MANEINLQQDTGLTLTAKVYSKAGTQQGSTTSLSEVATGIYSGNFNVSGLGDAEYIVDFIAGGIRVGFGGLFVRDGLEVTQEQFEKKTEADARQVLLIAEHDATQATLAGLNDFDPAVDVVERVTLVDTTTTNTDMRGTDSAITSLTPVTDAITAQTVDLKGASDKDLTQVFNNTPIVNLTPVTDALALQDIEIATIKTQSTLARKHLTNRDKIDTTAKTLTRYDDDGTTALVVFDLKDNAGAPSALAIFEKDPQ